MALRPVELGELQHVDVLPGTSGFPHWRGVAREGDPSSIDDNAVWNAENVRLVSGHFVSRGGEAKVNSSTIGASTRIDGFFEAGDVGA